MLRRAQYVEALLDLGLFKAAWVEVIRSHDGAISREARSRPGGASVYAAGSIEGFTQGFHVMIVGHHDFCTQLFQLPSAQT